GVHGVHPSVPPRPGRCRRPLVVEHLPVQPQLLSQLPDLGTAVLHHGGVSRRGSDSASRADPTHRRLLPGPVAVSLHGGRRPLRSTPDRPLAVLGHRHLRGYGANGPATRPPALGYPTSAGPASNTSCGTFLRLVQTAQVALNKLFMQLPSLSLKRSANGRAA